MSPRHLRHDWGDLHRLAAVQQGLVTLDQARACGFPRQTLREIAQKQGWTSPLPGVLALPGSADTPHRRVAAILLHVGQPAAVTGWTAAWLHGLRTARPTVTEVLLPAGRRAPSLAMVQARRTRHWSERHLTQRSGITVVEIPRMLCDLASRANENALRPLLIDARQQGLTTLDEVAAVTAELANAPGTALVRALVTALRPATADSELEWRWRRRLQEAGLHPDAGPCVIVFGNGRRMQIDIPFLKYQVGLETDSFGFHADRTSLDTDALRHNGAMTEGWLVLRATWTHLGRDSGEVVAALRSALVQRGWEATG